MIRCLGREKDFAGGLAAGSRFAAAEAKQARATGASRRQRDPQERARGTKAESRWLRAEQKGARRARGEAKNLAKERKAASYLLSPSRLEPGGNHGSLLRKEGPPVYGQ